MQRAPWLVALFVVLFALLAIQAGPVGKEAEKGKNPPQKVQIEGFVFNSSRNPLGGVDVSVWVAGKQDSVKGGKTDPKTGKYSIDVDVTGTFDVSFRHSRYFTSVVTQLSEKKNQQISKVLYIKGEDVPPSAVHEILQSIDRVLFLASALSREQQADFIRQFDSGSGAVLSPFGLREAVETAVVSQSPSAPFLNESYKQTQNRLKVVLTGKE